MLAHQDPTLACPTQRKSPTPSPFCQGRDPTLASPTQGAVTNPLSVLPGSKPDAGLPHTTEVTNPLSVLPRSRPDTGLSDTRGSHQPPLRFTRIKTRRWPAPHNGSHQPPLRFAKGADRRARLDGRTRRWPRWRGPTRSPARARGRLSEKPTEPAGGSRRPLPGASYGSRPRAATRCEADRPPAGPVTGRGCGPPPRCRQPCRG